MEISFSTFPIVIQNQPGRGRRHNQNDSTFVRAHVMGRYHQERREGASRNMGSRAGGQTQPKSQVATTFIEYAAPLAPSCGGREGLKIEKSTGKLTALQKRKLETECRTVEPRLSPDAAEISSFQLRDPRVQQSLMFMEIYRAYFQILEYRQAPLDLLSKSWLPAAFADLALFHAILFNFSQHLYALCSIDHEKPALLIHKVDAIREISARMESQVQGCSDAVIASILCLVSHELLNKDTAALQAHVRGLRQIISIRSGVDMLGLDGTLKTVYLNYELLLATVFKSWALEMPPLPAIMRHYGCVNIHSMPHTLFTLGRTSVDSTSHGFSNAAIQELCALEQMFSYPDSTVSSNICTDPINIPISTEDIEDGVLSDAKETETDHVLVSLQLAISLHFSALDPPPAPSLVQRLKYHLTRSYMQSFWHPFPGALLFCLIVGMVASKKTPYRPWFVANLMRLTTSLALENWEGLRECLCCFGELGVVD